MESPELKKPEKFPPQHQEQQPGLQHEMTPQPESRENRHPINGTFLASENASYMSGQVLHPSGGEIVNG